MTGADLRTRMRKQRIKGMNEIQLNECVHLRDPDARCVFAERERTISDLDADCAHNRSDMRSGFFVMG